MKILSQMFCGTCRTYHQDKNPTNSRAFILVRMKGLEPSRREALAPKASVSTNSTTSACVLGYVKCSSFLSFRTSLFLAKVELVDSVYS